MKIYQEIDNYQLCVRKRRDQNRPCQVLSARLAAYTLPMLGGRRYTALSNMSMVVAWVLLGRV